MSTDLIQTTRPPAQCAHRPTSATRSNLRRWLLLAGTAAFIQFIGGLLADFVFGPIAVSIARIPAATSNNEWGVFVAFVIQNGLVAIGFGIAGRVLKDVLADTWFYTCWLINSTTALAVIYAYFRLLIDGKSSPSLYHSIGGDAAHAIWILVVAIGAVLPLSTYFEFRFCEMNQP